MTPNTPDHLPEIDSQTAEEIETALTGAIEKLLEASSVDYPEDAEGKDVLVFGDHFMEFFGSHAQVDKAGPAAAYFLGGIPWSDDELENAMIGMTVLTDLLRSVQKIQQHDREFVASRDDEQLSESSSDSDDELQKLPVSGGTKDANRGASSSIDPNQTQIDRAVADSRASGDGEYAAGASAEVEVESRQSAEEGTAPQTFVIPQIDSLGRKMMVEFAVPNWSGLPPDEVMERMSDWFPKMVLAVATGSGNRSETPRIDPLLVKDPRITKDVILERCDDIRGAFAHTGESPFNRLIRVSHEVARKTQRVLENPNATDEEIETVQREMVMPMLGQLEDVIRGMGVDIPPMPELPSERRKRLAQEGES